MADTPARSTSAATGTSQDGAFDVVMLITGLGKGGAEHQLVQAVERLAARGWRVGVVSMLPLNGYADHLASLGVPVETLGMRRGHARPWHVVRLARLLRTWKPRVLHCHMVHANLLGRVVRLVAPLPAVVSTVQSEVEGGALRTIAYRLTDRLADVTTGVSGAVVERYVRIGAVSGPSRLRLIPNSVNIARFRPDAEARIRTRAALGLGDAFVWLAVGRLDVRKDYPNLLHAYAGALASDSDGRLADSVLLIAGEGPLKAEIETLAENLGLTERVRLLGLRPDVPDLMNAADAFVMSSAFEGLALVSLEAAATGLAVVTTTAGGARELFGESPYIVPTRDSVALGAAMTRLASLTLEARTELGEAGRARVEAEYSAEHVADMWEALYREVAGSARRLPESP